MQIDGEKATQHFASGELFGGKPELLAFYHPQCPHCHTMIEDFVKVADNHKEVNVVAINMSKSDARALDVNGYPTIRLNKGKEGGLKAFDGRRRDYNGFEEFLKREGVTQ